MDNSLNLLGYTDLVHAELEKFYYPEIVEGFDPVAVALSMFGVIRPFFQMGHSHRMCAIVIFSMTMNEQIIPHAKRQVKH